MNKARFIGTFSAIPGVAGFELPIFRTRSSDMSLLQVINYEGKVSELVHEELSGVNFIFDRDILTHAGSPAVFAFRLPDNSLHVGVQNDLVRDLTPIVEDGSLDALPLLRFRLSSFCHLSGRLPADARSAWAWIKGRSSVWAADNWKLEATIVPEFRRSIAICLGSAGEEEASVEKVWRRIDARVDSNSLVSLSVCLPGDFPWAKRCLDILTSADNLVGEAAEWWPELADIVPSIILTASSGDDQETPVEHDGKETTLRGPELLSAAKQFLNENGLSR